MGKWGRFRTVRLEKEAEDFIDQTRKKDDQFDDYWRGVEWRLARAPEGGAPMQSSDSGEYWVIRIPRNEIAKTRTLWIFYSFTQNMVLIYRVRFE